ncbi:MAG: hypothetical protein Q9188_004816 [Gyalolechia gomerana]
MPQKPGAKRILLPAVDKETVERMKQTALEPDLLKGLSNTLDPKPEHKAAGLDRSSPPKPESPVGSSYSHIEADFDQSEGAAPPKERARSQDSEASSTETKSAVNSDVLQNGSIQQPHSAQLLETQGSIHERSWDESQPSEEEAASRTSDTPPPTAAADFDPITETPSSLVSDSPTDSVDTDDPDRSDGSTRRHPAVKRFTRIIQGMCGLFACCALLLSLCCSQLSLPPPMQQVCLAARAPLLCPHALCCINGADHWISTFSATHRRRSSGKSLASGFAQTYMNLSQAVAASNILYKEPPSISQRRLDLREMAMRLPPDSAALKPINDFLHHSLGMDQALMDFIYGVARLGNLAMRKHSATSDTLASVRQSSPSDTLFSDYAYAIGWKNAQERSIQKQLKYNIDILQPAVNQVYRQSTQQLMDFSRLREMAADIRICIEDDRTRFGRDKADLMKLHHAAIRLLIKSLGTAEPGEVVYLTQALVFADEILSWAQETEGWLQKLVPYLANVKASVDALSDALHGQGHAIRWAPTEEAKVAALNEFLILVEEGVAPLKINTRAWGEQSSAS